MKFEDRRKLTKAMVWGAGLVHLIGDAVAVYGAYKAKQENNINIFINYMAYGYGALQLTAFGTLAGLRMFDKRILKPDEAKN